MIAGSLERLARLSQSKSHVFSLAPPNIFNIFATRIIVAAPTFVTAYAFGVFILKFQAWVTSSLFFVFRGLRL